MMKLEIFTAAVCTNWGALAAAILPRGDPTPAKVEPIEAKYFKELGAKRVKISYGPYEVPGSGDPETHGMQKFHDYNAMMPCHDCVITGYTVDLQFEDGKSANANKNMWLHHIGMMNLNRTDLACEIWPERMNVNGNERSPFDYTLKGTRKAGYYLKKGDEVFLATDIMNTSPDAKKLYLVLEWEFLEGSPAGFDIIFPIWLDLKGGCLNETTNVGPEELVFTAKGATGWTSKHSGDMLLMVSHIHDGNTQQDIFLDGKPVCKSVPAYGETAEFVTHDEGGGHGHDHGESEHIYHVSSITQCTNVAKVVPGSHFTITSTYDMKEHVGQKDHHGEPEPIMGIQFLHLARPWEEAMKDILAAKPGDLKDFQDQVQGKKSD